jgi:hypothetical protein
MAKVKLSFDEERTNLLREQINENKDEIDAQVQKLISTMDGVPIGVALAALLFTILSCVKGYFGKSDLPKRFEAMDQIGFDLIQFIHLVLLKKF